MFSVCKLVIGFGVDPALRISVFDELTLGEGFDGVTQVQGFHSESRAFHFQGTITHIHSLSEVKMYPDEMMSMQRTCFPMITTHFILFISFCMFCLHI